MRILKLLLLLVIGNVLNLANVQSPVAVVHSVAGKAWVKQSKDAKPSLLKKGDPLFAGQWVSCAGRCRELTISQCRLDVPIGPVPTWQQIVAINCFSKHGTRGGRAKGEGITILSPKESERLRPEAFLLKWKPFAAPTKLELSLKIYLGEKIWGQKTIDGSKGTYESPSLKAALNKAQETDQLILVLILDDENNLTQRVKFYLLSKDDEKNLERYLAKLNKESNAILRAMGRGAVFSDYDLYGEATKELERALVIAEKQKANTRTLAELTTLAIDANYMAYNDARVKELCKSPELRNSDLPGHCLISR